MHKAILRLLLGSLLLTIITATAPPRCQAADNATSEPAKEKKHPRIPFRGKITSVDKNAMTLTLEGKEKNRTIHVTSQTRILKGGKAATLGDVAVGDEVSGQITKTAEGKEEAGTVRI